MSYILRIYSDWFAVTQTGQEIKMKTKVQIYICDVDRKLAFLALLRNPSAHADVIVDLQASLVTADPYKREFMIDVNGGAVWK